MKNKPDTKTLDNGLEREAWTPYTEASEREVT